MPHYKRNSANDVPVKWILIVDDDFDVREALCDVLIDYGYTVLSAGDGREALAVLDREPAPQLILLDLRMPHMDGLQFRAAQQEHPLWSTIPVIFLSADARVEEKQALLGPVALLAKPVELDRLLAAIQAHV